MRRGVYCGAIGFIDADNDVIDLNVAIRTFTMSHETADARTSASAAGSSRTPMPARSGKRPSSRRGGCCRARPSSTESSADVVARAARVERRPHRLRERETEHRDDDHEATAPITIGTHRRHPEGQDERRRRCMRSSEPRRTRSSTSPIRAASPRPARNESAARTPFDHAEPAAEEVPLPAPRTSATSATQERDGPALRVSSDGVTTPRGTGGRPRPSRGRRR